MVELLDFSYDRLTVAQIRAAGRAGVIRYVASGRPAVSATKAEVDSYRAAGLSFCGVWQNGKSRALGGYPAGLVDARDAVNYCAGLGRVASDPVYFAVDVDITTGDQLAAVGGYFRAVGSVLGWAQVGAYGDYDVIAHLIATTPICLFWQSAATSHSGGRLHPAANLHQYATDQNLNGSAVDFDRSLTPNYGQWGTMALKSSPRSGAPVLWVVIHTAEGAYDDNPADPSIDPGSVDQLRNFFADPNTQASSHAGCDDDRLSDGWVPYDRAAWTLRDGNSISDNLEMCGRAGWTRAQWLTHRPMIRNAARWAAGRCQARGIPARRLTAAQVAARNVAGIIDHNTYTQATGDGSHWDVGPGFPWDLFLSDVNNYMQGLAVEEDDMTPIEMRRELERFFRVPTDQPMSIVAPGQAHNQHAFPIIAGAYTASFTQLRSLLTQVTEVVGASRDAVLGALAVLHLDLSDEDVQRIADDIDLPVTLVDEIRKAVNFQVTIGTARDDVPVPIPTPEKTG